MESTFRIHIARNNLMRMGIRLVLMALILAIVVHTTVLAQGTAFTYQGRLQDGGAPASGIYDLRFRLAADSQGNTYIGNPIIVDGQSITNGLFMALLDFGPVFSGPRLWLEVDVKTNGAAGYTILNPLQALTPSPYAVTAGNLTGDLPTAQLTGTVASTQLAGTYSNAVTFSNPGNNFAGAFNGDGNGLNSLNADNLAGGSVPDGRLGPNVARTNQVWLIGGNSGTTAGPDFLGTSDGRKLLIRGSFVGIGRTNPITASEFFGIDAPGLGYGGMYVDMTNSNSKPFYGYGLGGLATAWHYLDGTDGNKWKLNIGGADRITVTPGGQIGINTNSPVSALQVNGTISATYLNSTDTNVTSGITGVMVKQFDNNLRTAGAAALNSFAANACGFINSGPTCASPENVGQIGWGGSTSRSGGLPSGGSAEHWYTLSWATSGANYHPHIYLSSGAAYYTFDVCLDCNGTFIIIGSQNWETTSTITVPPGTAAYIRVRPYTANPTCQTFTVVFQNG
jgi:hypothetical protein